jgi:hypothetical protein
MEETEAEIETGKSNLDIAQRNLREESGQAEGVRLKASEPLPVSPPTRFWSSKVFIQAAIILLTGTVVTVYYWPRPPLSTQHSALGTRY